MCPIRFFNVAAVFSQAGVDLHTPTLTTCYNGLTACMIALAADKCGASADHFNVYIVSHVMISMFTLICGPRDHFCACVFTS